MDQIFAAGQDILQRAAQVVRRHAQKLVLELVQPLQLGVFLGQIALGRDELVVQQADLIIQSGIGPRDRCGQRFAFGHLADQTGQFVVDPHHLFI